jgi:hypothetical protein
MIGGKVAKPAAPSRPTSQISLDGIDAIPVNQSSIRVRPDRGGHRLTWVGLPS